MRSPDIRNPHLTRFLRHRYSNDQEQADFENLMDIINKFRILCNQSWREFILSAIATHVEQDNELLATAIRQHLLTKRKPGRPKGTGVKQQLRKMGVNPDDITDSIL